MSAHGDHRAAPRGAAPPPMQARDLPPYATMLAAYHRAHADELRAMIADLPIRPGDRVLDMACGAGTYTRWLAECVGPHGRVVGVDIDKAFLDAAEKAVAAGGLSGRVHLRRADIAGLPFEDNSFDLVWCAQSMYTLPDPHAALRELRRVVRPGGTVAVFENDTIHQVLLPWPAGLELAVRQAQLRSFVESSGRPGCFYLARDFYAAFSAAGFAGCRVAAYTSVRQAPLEPDERTFLDGYLQDIHTRAAPFLDPAHRAHFQALIDNTSGSYLLDTPAFCATYIDLLACGTK